MERKPILRSEKGFTLIEIISVLVLIGILAAVAVPKFINLQADARDKAVEAAVAEGIAQVNLYSARFILQNGRVPADLSELTGMTPGPAMVASYNAGDFTIDFADDGGGGIDVTATGTAASLNGVTMTKNVPLPTP